MKNRKKKDWQERFWVKVDKTENCWEWRGSKDINSYGKFWYKEKSRKAHNVIWEAVNNEELLGRHVLHSCDNPGCVNPAHLFVGTHVENMKDKKIKGRAAGSVIKLTHNQCYRLRKLTQNQNFTSKRLGHLFTIHTETISQFKRKLKFDPELYTERQKNSLNNLPYQQICNRYKINYDVLWYNVSAKGMTKEEVIKNFV